MHAQPGASPLTALSRRRFLQATAVGTDVRGRTLRLRGSGLSPKLEAAAGWHQFTLPSVLDHELVVIE